MPEALREAAAELGFPLFEVPYEVPFIAVTEKAASHLVNEHYAVLQRALSAHERLERIVLSERGLDGVADGDRLADRRPGADLRRARRARARAHRQRSATTTVEELRAELRGRIRDGARRGYAPGGELEGRALALPVVRTPRNGTAQRGALPHAWLVAAKDGGALNEFDRLTLHQAVTIVALELLRRRVADDTERRLAGDLLTALVSGELTGPDLARRLEPFGLGDRVGVLVLQPPRAIKAEVEEALATTRCATRRAAWPAAPAARSSCALLPAGDDDEPFELAERIRARVARGSARAAGRRGPRRRAGRAAAGVPRGALRAGGARAGATTAHGRGRRCSPPTATSAPSSCCSRCRTTTRCGCSATRSCPRSRRARAPTAAS